ncbi:MAG: thioredoxin family protein [Chitinophagaceae bacterium]
MKYFLICCFFLGSLFTAVAQDMKKFNLYKPDEDASVALSNVIKEAKASGKHVMIQIGGNWCVWCARFYDFVNNDKQLDSSSKAGYVVYHLNYSKENMNKELLAKFGYPQRFGFPVFIILDGEGKRIHTQNSSYLEQDKSYSKEKILEFFESWNPKALDPIQYKNY